MIALALVLSMAQTPFADEDFWALDGEALSQRARDVPEGVTLFAPARVDLAARATLPALTVRKGPLSAPMAHGPVGYVAIEVGGEHGWSGWSWTQEGDTPAPEQPTDEALARYRGTTRLPDVADLRQQLLELPWRPMKLRVWAIASDRWSAPVDVVLEGPPAPAERAERAPTEAPVAAPGKAPVEVTAKGILITPKAPGLVHVVTVGRRISQPAIETYRVKGPFVVPRPEGEAWIYVLTDGSAEGPMRVAPRKAHPQKTKKR